MPVVCVCWEWRGRGTASIATRMTAEKSRDVLYTLLPRDVLERMEAPDGASLLGTSGNISACSVMFVHTSCVLLQKPGSTTPTPLRSIIAQYAAEANSRTLAGSADQGESALQEFEALHCIFCKWDRLVEEAGLYKYQHVNEWYIVTCPRATQPYDAALQALPYPHQFLPKFLKLADGILQVVAACIHLSVYFM